MNPNVLEAIDRPGWAFNNIADQKVKHLSCDFNFTITPYPQVKHEVVDLFVAYWWASFMLLKAITRAKHSILCMYDHYSWAAPAALARLEEAAKEASLIVVSSERLLADVKAKVRTTTPVMVVEDGVDTTMFRPLGLTHTPFTVGWTGNSGATKVTLGTADDVKGLSIIREGCKLAGAPLRALDLAETGVPQHPHDTMPSWYRDISVYCCASECEGTPNPVLEAMACSRPVVTTEVGITNRLVVPGLNGQFCSRTPEGIATAIDTVRSSDLVKMGQLARISAMAHDWQYKVQFWRTALYTAMER